MASYDHPQREIALQFNVARVLLGHKLRAESWTADSSRDAKRSIDHRRVRLLNAADSQTAPVSAPGH